jgi:putative drug/metabolite transporter DUF486
VRTITVPTISNIFITFAWYRHLKFRGAALWKVILATLLMLTTSFSASTQTVTPSPETGVTPNALLLFRADLIAGKEAAYAQTEAEIVRGYISAKIPAYWLALQSTTGTPHVLYFDGFDSFAAVEQSGGEIAQGLSADPEVASLQQKLQDYVSATQTVLAFRRDDLGYRLNKIDLAAARYVRVSILQFRPGYEEEFADAVHARARIYETNDIDTPWMFYQVHSGLPLPTFIEFQPMNSLSEIDDWLERSKKNRQARGEARQVPTQKWMKDAELHVETQIYSVSLPMSNLPAQQAAAAATSARNRFSTASVSEYTLAPRP